MALALSQLLQIADSAFPTGAFAYSSGLEAVARAGRFTSLRALEAFLEAQVLQAADYDLAFVAAAHEGAAADAARDDLEEFGDLCLEWDATLWNAGMHAASLRQGRALLDALAGTFPHPRLASLQARRDADAAFAAVFHFAPVLGRALAALGASRAQACDLYLHGLARDQVAAAVRLGIVGPRAAQTLQASVLRRAGERAGSSGALPAPRDARRTAPIAETGQGAHGFLYSRLFQN